MPFVFVISRFMRSNDTSRSDRPGRYGQGDTHQLQCQIQSR